MASALELEQEYGTKHAEISEKFGLQEKTLPELQALYEKVRPTMRSVDDFMLCTSLLKELLRRGYSWEEADDLLK